MLILRNKDCAITINATLDFFFLISDAADHYRKSTKAFIFSLHNSKEGMGPFKSTTKKGSSEYAIYPSDRWGPYFADKWIFIADNANKNKKSHFTLSNPTYYYRPTGKKYHGDGGTILAGSEYASPDDWEVFYLGTSNQ